jgi:hypothetical protein
MDHRAGRRREQRKETQAVTDQLPGIVASLDELVAAESRFCSAASENEPLVTRVSLLASDFMSVPPCSDINAGISQLRSDRCFPISMVVSCWDPTSFPYANKFRTSQHEALNPNICRERLRSSDGHSLRDKKRNVASAVPLAINHPRHKPRATLTGHV